MNLSRNHSNNTDPSVGVLDKATVPSWLARFAYRYTMNEPKTEQVSRIVPCNGGNIRQARLLMVYQQIDELLLGRPSDITSLKRKAGDPTRQRAQFANRQAA